MRVCECVCILSKLLAIPPYYRGTIHAVTAGAGALPLSLTTFIRKSTSEITALRTAGKKIFHGRKNCHDTGITQTQ